MLYRLLNCCIALVWFVNGLYCKVLNQVPRHTDIVSRILKIEEARPLTTLIGMLEILMSIWILSNYKSRLVVGLQAFLILSMNTLEFFLARDLLLFGGMNLIFALMLVAIILINEFRIKTSAS